MIVVHFVDLADVGQIVRATVVVVAAAGRRGTRADATKVFAAAAWRAHHRLLLTATLSKPKLEHAVEQLLLTLGLAGRLVELGEAQTLAHFVAHVAGEEQREAFDAQISVAVVGAKRRVYLWVGVEIAHALYVDDNELVVGRLECEVAESVRRVAHVGVLDKARVGIVLDVGAVDKVLQVV